MFFIFPENKYNGSNKTNFYMTFFAKVYLSIPLKGFSLPFQARKR